MSKFDANKFKIVLVTCLVLGLYQNCSGFNAIKVHDTLNLDSITNPGQVSLAQSSDFAFLSGNWSDQAQDPEIFNFDSTRVYFERIKTEAADNATCRVKKQGSYSIFEPTTDQARMYNLVAADKIVELRVNSFTLVTSPINQGDCQGYIANLRALTDKSADHAVYFMETLHKSNDAQIAVGNSLLTRTN